MTKTRKPEFRPNDFVVYPAHGVGRIISIEHYGASADYARIYTEFGITAQAVADAARDSVAVVNA